MPQHRSTVPVYKTRRKSDELSTLDSPVRPPTSDTGEFLPSATLVSAILGPSDAIRARWAILWSSQRSGRELGGSQRREPRRAECLSRLDREANTGGKSPYPPAYPLWQLAVDGRKGKPLPMRRLRVADACLPETGISETLASRAIFGRSRRRAGGGDPPWPRPHSYIPSPAFFTNFRALSWAK